MSSNDNSRVHSSDLSFTQKIPSGPASPLRTVIGRIGPENGGISRWEDQVSTYHWWRDGAQQDITGDTRLQRESRKQDNQAKFGKQPSGTPLPVAIAPTLQYKLIRSTEDYRLKC